MNANEAREWFSQTQNFLNKCGIRIRSTKYQRWNDKWICYLKDYPIHFATYYYNNRYNKIIRENANARSRKCFKNN